ncbi:MAG: hypothetical protein CMJ48_09670 [Planctomycetaceae bacterium]|nr:hypothetical protein [Planctomycetaceae bacterium]
MSDGLPALESSALRRILLLQSSISSAPDEKGLMDMIANALSSLPGVDDCVVCIEGASSKQLDAPAIVGVPSASKRAETPSSNCAEGSPAAQERWQRIELRTPRHEYGDFILQVRDQAAFAPYQALAGNTANLVALHIENERRAAELSQLNRDLEEQLRDRTQQLAECESRYRLLAENADAAFGIFDKTGTLVMLNEKNAAILGGKPDDFIGKSLHEIFPESADFHMQRFAKILREKKGDRFEDPFPLRDGEHWFSSNLQPVIDHKGDAVGIQIVAVDITERKRAEEAQKKSEQTARALLNATHDAAFLIDPGHWTVLALNDKAAQGLGKSADEIVGRSIDALMPSQVAARRIARGEEVIRSREVVCFEDERQGLHFDNRMYPILGPQGDVVQIAVFAQDITNRKQTEQALRVNEERLELAISVTNDGMYDWDVPTNTVYFDSRYYTMAGYRPNEFPGTFDEWARRVHPNDSIHVQDAVKQYLSGEAAKYDEEFRFRRKDGEWMWIRARVKIIERDEQGTPLRIVGTHTDVTDRKRIEWEREELIAKLEDQNAELERFAYTVSHDLKSPLITIKGFVELLRQDLAVGDAEAVEDALLRICSATDAMNQLLTDLLELSRIGRLVNPPEDVPLQQLAREACELVRGQIEESGVRVDITADLPVVFGDRLRLLEVFQNLIGNAVKYMGDQPDPHIEIGSRLDAETTVYYVRDNGIGIEPRFHEKVFGLFDQLDQNAEGSGIGLALIKRIVEAHDGRVWIESEGAGCGATFCFTIAPPPTSESIPKSA